jgi:hypothetical protein
MTNIVQSKDLIEHKAALPRHYNRRPLDQKRKAALKSRIKKLLQIQDAILVAHY